MQKYPGQRFETTDCKVRAQRKHPLAEPRECDCGCGEIFTPDSWELDRRFKKRECYARWLRKHPAEPRECECGCGTIFIPDGWNAANGGGHYLNSQHAWRHYWKVGKGPPRGRIAKASGGSRQRWLGDWDGGRPQVDADEIIEILRLDERGHSRQGIADRVGRSKPSVIRVMTIVQMHAEGSPVSEIAHRAHTSERVANHVISAATKV